MRKERRGGLILVAMVALMMAGVLMAFGVDHNEPTAPAGFNVQSNQAVSLMLRTTSVRVAANMQCSVHRNC